MFLRNLISAFAALIVSGCNLGLASVVDAVPFGARLAEAPFSDGVWCPIDDDEAGQLVVRSAQQTPSGPCAAMRWDASRRLVVAIDESDPTKPPDELAFADLGGGLFLMQYTEHVEEGSGQPQMFILMASMAHGEAIAIVPLPSDESVIPMAARYPGITVSPRHIPMMTPSQPADAPEGAEPPPSPHRYISHGDPEQIRSLSSDLVKEVLRNFAARAEAAQTPPGHGILLPALVRAERGAPDHAPTSEQLRDLEALMEKLRALAAH